MNYEHPNHRQHGLYAVVDLPKSPVDESRWFKDIRIKRLP